ncbi:hypothetical protein [Gandjariella thermophila]|uniref:Uncharacterized protein n=1 Tax=Gandjariella thermophila TaxID=1931992 RepID=A0A4D4J7P4_9PSEU|nr:hypothetical protein [Gandjariella thermophila]GDY32671.1 hypothetical protein GTS_43040 [Gandjariella thermophila]
MQAKPGHTVVIHDIRVKILRRAAPPTPDAATVVQLQSGGCGGNIEPHHFHASRDDPVPRLAPDRGETTTFPYSVSEGDPQEFDLTLLSYHCDRTWVPEIVWSVDGRVGVTDYSPQSYQVAQTGFHTVPSGGYPRVAWLLDAESSPPRWLPARFDDDALRVPDPD